MAPSAAGHDVDMDGPPSGVSVEATATNGSGEPLTLLRPMEQPAESSDVCIVGAGPAGLMLA